MKYEYLTLANFSEFLYKEKGSKFLALCVSVSNEEQIKHQLKKWHEEHPQATHICYAFKIGVNKVQFRANDDGEPSNSAGAPILGQINSFHLTNVLIGVVRYYGGTKLGVGGLISAYKIAAKNAIEANEIITKELSTQLKFTFSFEEMPSILNKIKSAKINIVEQQILAICFLSIEFPTHKSEEIMLFLQNYSSFQLIKETKEL